MIDFAPYIAAIAGFLGLIFAAYRKGGKDTDAKHTAKKAKADDETNKRIDGRPPVDPHDHDDITDRLRKLGPKR